MIEMDDLLQERLELLEAGEPLERCLDGVSEEVAQALQMAAMMRGVAVPASAAESLTAERAALLSLAAAELLPEDTLINNNGINLIMERFQAWIEGRSAFDWVVAAVLGPALVVTALILVGSLFGDEAATRQVDMEPTAESVVAAVTEDATVVPTEDVTVVTPTAEPADTEVEAAATEVAAGPTPTRPAHQLFLPLNGQIAFSPETAILDEILGVVEVQQTDGSWKQVVSMTQLGAGNRVRTAEFSSAKITFNDDSYAVLGAESELSLDMVDVKRPEDGFRTLVMTQWRGESEHEVAFRNDGGSLYEVKTPDQGSGIARGTRFKVIFNPGQLSRYIVMEGKVDVQGNNGNVSVVAGQLTVFPIGLVPIEPVYSIFGEGEVTAVGETWTVAGQTFLTDEYTVIVGNPQVGDLVRIDGHLLADGGRVADRIVLIRRALVNEFSITGEVEAMGGGAWTVAGQTVVVGNQTVIDEGIDVGDEVQVKGIILADGLLQAQLITEVDDDRGLPFSFGGVVEGLGDHWVISGQVIEIDDDTAIDDDIELDDVVAVSGWILADGTWVATVIVLDDDDLATFEFTGLVQGTGPWLVAGVSFETRPWTNIQPEIRYGDQVHVRGVILQDGTKVAESITLLYQNEPNVVSFVGVVSGIDPWVINGIPLVVTGDTVIGGEITVGLTVAVQAVLRPNGNWVILSVRPLYPSFGLGCFFLSSPVTTLVNASTIQVRHWQGNIGINGIGNVAVNHVVTLPLCTGWDGTIVVINTGIVVIYQPVIVIINGGGGVAVPVPPGCKVTKKGNIKCSNKGSNKSSKKSS